MMGGKFNLGSLMKNAKKIQEMMQDAQNELAKIRVVGESGAGMVKITVTAHHDVISVELADELLQESKEVIEDLIKAATNNANEKATKIAQEKMMMAGNLFGVDSNDSGSDEST